MRNCTICVGVALRPHRTQHEECVPHALDLKTTQSLYMRPQV